MMQIHSISIVGSGNLAWHLALAFANSGLKVDHVISRNAESGKEIARLVDAVWLDLDGLHEPLSDLIILCVSDNAIEDIFPYFREFEKPIVHTSGSIGIEVFSDYKTAGVLYPLQTFSRNKTLDYSEIPFFIEATEKSLEMTLEKLARRISSKVYHAHSADRRKIHLSAVFACNFTNHLIDVANHKLDETGLDISVLQPLVRETFEKLSVLPPGEAQTGPAVREDRSTIEKHLALMDPESNEYKIYKLLTENIIAYKR